MGELTATTERYLAAVRDALAWLEDEGYREVKLLPVRTSFDVYYSSPRGRVGVSVDVGRRNADVTLAPPSSDAMKPIDPLREYNVSLGALRAIHGLPAVDGFLGTGSDDTAISRLRAYLQGLEALRDGELAGDWSRFREALAHRPPDVTAAVERIRDPQLRAIMRRYRPSR
jgi:hypothetical protein